MAAEAPGVVGAAVEAVALAQAGPIPSIAAAPGQADRAEVVGLKRRAASTPAANGTAAGAQVQTTPPGADPEGPDPAAAGLLAGEAVAAAVGAANPDVGEGAVLRRPTRPEEAAGSRAGLRVEREEVAGPPIEDEGDRRVDATREAEAMHLGPVPAPAAAGDAEAIGGGVGLPRSGAGLELEDQAVVAVVAVAIEGAAAVLLAPAASALLPAVDGPVDLPAADGPAAKAPGDGPAKEGLVLQAGGAASRAVHGGAPVLRGVPAAEGVRAAARPEEEVPALPRGPQEEVQEPGRGDAAGAARVPIEAAVAAPEGDLPPEAKEAAKAPVPGKAGVGRTVADHLRRPVPALEEAGDEAVEDEGVARIPRGVGPGATPAPAATTVRTTAAALEAAAGGLVAPRAAAPVVAKVANDVVRGRAGPLPIAVPVAQPLVLQAVAAAVGGERLLASPTAARIPCQTHAAPPSGLLGVATQGAPARPPMAARGPWQAAGPVVLAAAGAGLKETVLRTAAEATAWGQVPAMGGPDAGSAPLGGLPEVLPGTEEAVLVAPGATGAGVAGAVAARVPAPEVTGMGRPARPVATGWVVTPAGTG